MPPIFLPGETEAPPLYAGADSRSPFSIRNTQDLDPPCQGKCGIPTHCEKGSGPFPILGEGTAFLLFARRLGAQSLFAGEGVGFPPSAQRSWELVPPCRDRYRFPILH